MSLELPVGVGVVGLGRIERFHLERLSLRRDLRVVAVHDVDARRAEAAQACGGTFHPDWKQFLQHSNIQAVLLATPPATRAELAIEALTAGKHVIVDTPLADSSEDADRMLAAARGHDRVLCTVNHRRAEDDFQAALDAVCSGEMGRLRAVQFVSWDYVASGDNQLPGETGDVLTDLAARRIDQLLHLVRLEPRGVYAQVSTQAEGPAVRTLVEFTGGVSAHLEIDSHAVTPIRTGWVLSGLNGGYANLRRYTLTDDGEIFDVPVPSVQSSGESTYDAVIDDLNAGNAIPAGTLIARNSIALLEAMRDSAQRKTVVPVNFLAADSGL